MGNQENTNNAPQQDLNELLRIRREKLQNLQEAGKDPFVITKYNQEHHSDEVRALYEAHEAELLAGRAEVNTDGMDEAEAYDQQCLPELGLHP